MRSGQPFPSMTCLQFPKKHPAKALGLFEGLRDLFGKPAVHLEDTFAPGKHPGE